MNPDLFQPGLLGLIAIGTALGIVVGAIPGLTGAMLIALSLPLTFAMTGEAALALLVSMYVGSVSGGLITATLLKMPGTPASVITTLDGHPMAASGRPGRALGLGIGASLIGGLVSWVFLVLLARPAATWSTKLSPFDLFALVLVALVSIAAISERERGGLWRGLFSALLGCLFAMPGLHPATGQPRLTFGFVEMNDGFKLLPVLIGLFAFNQIIQDALKPSGSPKESSASQARDSLFLPARDWLRQIANLIRSSVLGTLIGILPGIGANVGSTVAYGAARSLSKEPEKFGTGCDDGIVASESANNATVGGALIPLISLGIPGSVIDAVLLGAFVIHGLQPGPLLFRNHPETVHMVTGSFLLANVVMFFLMLGAARWLVKLSRVPLSWLAPPVIVFCVVGSYALANRMFDVWMMIAFGLFGFIINRLRIPLAPFVIGFVLAPLAEENLSAGLMASGGSWLPIFTEPFALACLVIAATAAILSIRQSAK
ncbi:MAG: tripartite tricarboxylate transporter permease [Verrucomicrobiae bacterium]|nr:tripartite tricarboxylate transporter permease [Verrucomicrobiae bacterium]